MEQITAKDFINEVDIILGNEALKGDQITRIRNQIKELLPSLRSVSETKKVSDDEMESFNKSMSEMFRQHDYRAMYRFYVEMIVPRLSSPVSETKEPDGWIQGKPEREGFYEFLKKRADEWWDETDESRYRRIELLFITREFLDRCKPSPPLKAVSEITFEEKKEIGALMGEIADQHYWGDYWIKKYTDGDVMKAQDAIKLFKHFQSKGFYPVPEVKEKGEVCEICNGSGKHPLVDSPCVECQKEKGENNG